MDPEQWQNKAHILIKQYVQSGISEEEKNKTNLNQFIIQRELESIILSTNIWDFCQKR